MKISRDPRKQFEIIKVRVNRCSSYRELTVLGTAETDIQITVEGFKIDQSDSVKLLGVTLDKKLSFEKHTNSVCVKARRGIWCLRRVRNYLNCK